MCITHIYILSIYVTIEWYSSRTSTDIHGLTFASVHLQRLLLGPMEASLAEMRLYWTEQKEAKNGRFGMEKRPWLTGFVFCSCFFFRDREAESPQDPRFGKISFGSVRCANSEGEFASIYTSCEVIQVVLNKSDLLR